ncbi:peptidase S41 [Flavobacterium magnum]|uniref:Peptidase S41 n=1 Tax=Flavobacterium magnum TaxID=2162713 RepID=A0A2S0RHB8_9FLAO|nr:S41 family peptidase [Flavobacterium magnum]AWA30680.1 peptidase S41 [Flavobacterium magnum]
MKRLLPVLLLCQLSLYAQDSSRACELVSKINTLVQREHYKPKPIDDSLSAYVFDDMMDRLDIGRNIFSKKDYDKLAVHRYKIDDYLTDGRCGFLDEFAETWKSALMRKQQTIEALRSVAFDYQSKDSVKFSKKNFDFDLAENDFGRVWQKRLRFEILDDISKTSKDLDSLKQHFTALEKASKAKVFDTNLCKVSSILENKKGLEYQLQGFFLDAFCNYFDPHSNYFSLDARSSFLSGLSTSNLSLGLDIALNEKEEIIVGDVIPGGPAARSEKFEKGDNIIKVANAKGEAYWVSCTSLETIGEMIFADTSRELTITLRKKNGNTAEVRLQKEIMKARENSVYSYIAEKNGTRVGYINIPNFYSDFENNSPYGCADDVVKEIIKLQDDKVDGIVIDLLDNGGGSMEEAIRLVGMFIDVGPVSILTNNKGRQEILKDTNRGMAYTGPVVILVNGFSASASEFFSAAMQDYNRAFVIGAPTLGKATMQTIMPLDNKNEDFVKLTVEKFYRITGESGQIRGVIPDIELPMLFDGVIKREDGFKTALVHDSITTNARFRRLLIPNKERVLSLSKARVQHDPRLTELRHYNEEIDRMYEKQRGPIRLTLTDVFKDVHEIDPLWDKVREITERPAGMAVINTTYETTKMGSDAFEKEINAYKIKDVKTSPYLEEAINIIRDYKDFLKMN